MLKHITTILAATFLVTTTVVMNCAFASDDNYLVGVRFNAVAESGTPANDMLGYGVYGKYFLKNNWALGFGVDSYSYDFENVSEFIGLSPGTKIVDAPTSATMLSAWAEKSYSWTDNAQWFWNAGLGINDVSVDPATGTLLSGGTYNIVTDAGTELVVLGSIGAKWRFAKNWETEASIRIEHHASDWTSTDTVSGTTKTLDSYTPRGLAIGLNYYF